MTPIAESFEDGIAERARSRRIQRLLAMWRSLDGDDAPHLADLVGAGLSDMAEHYCLMLPDGETWFAYVYYGRALAANTGLERTGTSTDYRPARLRDFLNAQYRRAFDSGRPVYVVNAAHVGPLVHTWERLIVPVRAATNTRMLLMMAEPHELHDNLSNAILEASPDGLMALRAIEDDLGTVVDAAILTVNESACRMSRRARDQLVQARLLKAFPHLKTNGIWELCLEVMEGGAATRFDIHSGLSSGDGQLRVTLFPLLGGAAMMLQDITDLSGDAIPLISRHASNVQHFAVNGF